MRPAELSKNSNPGGSADRLRMLAVVVCLLSWFPVLFQVATGVPYVHRNLQIVMVILVFGQVSGVIVSSVARIKTIGWIVLSVASTVALCLPLLFAAIITLVK